LQDGLALVQRDPLAVEALTPEEPEVLSTAERRLGTLIRDTVQDFLDVAEEASARRDQHGKPGVVALARVRSNSPTPKPKMEMDPGQMMKAMTSAMAACRSDNFMRNMTIYLHRLKNRTQEYVRDCEAQLAHYVDEANARSSVEEVADMARQFYNGQVTATRSFCAAVRSLLTDLQPVLPPAMKTVTKKMLDFTLQAFDELASQQLLAGDSSPAYVCKKASEVLVNTSEVVGDLEKYNRLTNHSKANTMPAFEKYVKEKRADIAPRLLFLTDLETKTMKSMFTSLSNLIHDGSAKARPVLERLPCELGAKGGCQRPSFSVLAGLAALAAVGLLDRRL